jgi:Sortase domain
MAGIFARRASRLRFGWAIGSAILILGSAATVGATGPSAGSEVGLGIGGTAAVVTTSTVERSLRPATDGIRADVPPGARTSQPPVTPPSQRAEPSPLVAPRVAVAVPSARIVAVPSARIVAVPSARIVATTYSGTNHMWMPALGINRPVYAFPCSRSRPPDNFVYRWGCAGRNNVYLFGHAWGVFQPLHDAYVGGRLRVGMEVVYADGAGRIRHYRITTWRVVPPTDSSWIGDMARPTMILQTCVGAASQYRLNVRLVAVP